MSNTIEVMSKNTKLLTYEGTIEISLSALQANLRTSVMWINKLYDQSRKGWRKGHVRPELTYQKFKKHIDKESEEKTIANSIVNKLPDVQISDIQNLKIISRSDFDESGKRNIEVSFSYPDNTVDETTQPISDKKEKTTSDKKKTASSKKTTSDKKKTTSNKKEKTTIAKPISDKRKTTSNKKTTSDKKKKTTSKKTKTPTKSDQ